jgi:hypothetical protein
MHEVLKKKEELKEKSSKEPKKTKKEMEEESRQEGLEVVTIGEINTKIKMSTNDVT